jgi:hypothetical protein
MKKVVLRFMACSDLHYKDADCVEKERFEEGLRQLYAYADSQEYSAVDAVYVVGDFANLGTREQMELVKESLDKGIRPGTVVNLCMSSHEYFGEQGEEGARKQFDEIFKQPADTHLVIKGYHFISITTTNGCQFYKPQIEFAMNALAEAHADTPKKAIFFFQHPHLRDTVYGSIAWGEAALIPILENYPQVIDFSGHSHAPINDPRSIHQDHVTSVGTGSFSYFEMDEYDKITRTFPQEGRTDAQMLIVEVFDDDSVLIKPYDVIAGRFFHDGWLIEKPWDPDSFIYTREKRLRTAEKPHFAPGSTLTAEQTEDGLHVVFDHACGGKEDINDYVITVRNSEGLVERRFVVWAPYYLTNRPEKMEYTLMQSLDKMPERMRMRAPSPIPPLEAGEYSVTVKARGFWYNESDNVRETKFTVE